MTRKVNGLIGENMGEEKRLRTKKLHVDITILGSKLGVVKMNHPWRLQVVDYGCGVGDCLGVGYGYCSVGDGGGFGVGK